MARVLVCVPVDDRQAAQLADGQALEGPLQVFTVTAELLETFGLQASDDEPAEYAALLLAGLWALLRHGRRLVLTTQLASTRLDVGAESANGGRTLRNLAPSEVEAWFDDEPTTPIAEVADQIAGLELDDAWEHPAVQRLHAEHDLLWHSVVELRKD